WEDQFGKELTDQSAVEGVNFVRSVSDAFQSTLNSLDVVTIILVVSAALLAFVVLYNLTNINVSERVRELSTIKVLGFYDNEVTMYIYRENIILTFMGIIAGLLFGYFLHGFVLQTVEIDQMMFSPVISVSSYIFASILTLVFSTIVMIAMHIKLKNIDMLEALKTIE
ncbi:MAG: ABC transporter permease, partial [Pisciglobus halotolerans]|nr:ABC transporter permease [Pisciglobus halotolerans]